MGHTFHIDEYEAINRLFEVDWAKLSWHFLPRGMFFSDYCQTILNDAKRTQEFTNWVLENQIDLTYSFTTYPASFDSHVVRLTLNLPSQRDAALLRLTFL